MRKHITKISAIVATLLTLMQSLGRASKASVLVLLRQIVIYIPAAMIMPHVAGIEAECKSCHFAFAGRRISYRGRGTFPSFDRIR